MSLSENYLLSVIHIFKGQKKLAEKAMGQLEPQDFHTLIDSESNSVAIIVKHLSGNMRSRWTDFLTSDGEKASRNRDDEFIDDFEDKQGIWNAWEEGWAVLLDTLESLEAADLDKSILIRNEPHLVMEAIQRQLSHYAYHVGQITFLSRHLCGQKWTTLSIAKGQSEAFNKKMASEGANEFRKGSL